ncbi:MAG: flagellar hook-basal body complex protein FliE [Pyrinomonadaceae bacterium]|nr:flagellar hook-basal body complex protein FliE [Pyrinomonadaceae bacterium]
MAIDNISGIQQSQALSALSSESKITRGEDGDGFGDAIKDAVESIDQTQKAADKEVAKAVTGDSPDLHQTIIALQTADLKFQLGLQVRNKLIGAYEEIMRMQV